MLIEELQDVCSGCLYACPIYLRDTLREFLQMHQPLSEGNDWLVRFSWLKVKAAVNYLMHHIFIIDCLIMTIYNPKGQLHSDILMFCVLLSVLLLNSVTGAEAGERIPCFHVRYWNGAHFETVH